MPTRIDGKLDAIVLAILGEIQSSLATDSESAFVSLDPDGLELSAAPGQFIYVIFPSGGTFDDTLIDGGGNFQATVYATIAIRIYSFVQLDEYGRDTLWLSQNSLGISEPMRQLLKLISQADMTDVDGNDLLREPIMPVAFKTIRPSREIGAIEVLFQVCYDWDLLS
ncbi:MAG: hypothetical protein KGL39_37220 [Patescibacteria group bacterium]|nr:hypothetical protein [Patescibacteria group bacterium]